MENLDICLRELNLLQNQLNGCESDSIHSTFRSIRLDFQPATSGDLNSDNHRLPPNLPLLTPQHLENGFIEEFLIKYFTKPLTLEQLLNELQFSLLQLKQIQQIVADYASKTENLTNSQIPYNGYRTTLKLNQITVQLLYNFLYKENTGLKLFQLLENSKSSIQNLQSQLYRIRIVVLVNLIQISLCVDSDSHGSNANEPNLFHPNTIEFYMNLFQKVVPYLGQYYVTDQYFFFHSKLRKILRTTSGFFVVVHRLPNSLILLFNKKRMARVASKTLQSPNMRWPLGTFKTLDDFFFRKLIINLYHFKTPVKSDTYFIPKQLEWKLKSLEEVLKRPEEPGFVYTGCCSNSLWSQPKVIKSNKFGQKEGLIRIRVLQHQKTKKDGTVLFHCHGGIHY